MSGAYVAFTLCKLSILIKYSIFQHPWLSVKAKPNLQVTSHLMVRIHVILLPEVVVIQKNCSVLIFTVER